MKVNLIFDPPEDALVLRMSADDCRQPRDLFHYLLREEAKRRGLLSADAPLPSHSPAHSQHPQAAQS